ncbi:MAG TPA: polysaccharide biosynthesis tyrosine autokinase [Chthoniobacterales bacterium]
MQSDQDPDSEKGAAVDWKSYVYAVRERIWMVFATTIIGTAIAIVLLMRSETFYQAQSVLLVASQQLRVLNNVTSVSGDSSTGAEIADTIASVLESAPFTLRVVERLHLNSNAEFLRSIGSTDKETDPQTAALRLAGMVRATPRRTARLIDVTVTSRDPNLSQLIANAVSNEYLQYMLSKRVDETRKAGELLKNEAVSLGSSLHAAELNLQRFRERERTSSVEALQKEAEQRLDEASKQISSFEQPLRQLQMDLAAAKANPDATEDMLRLPSVANQPKISSLTTMISQQERDLGVLAQRYRPKHPSYSAARTALDLTVSELHRALEDVVPIMEANEKQLKAQLEQARLTRNDTEKYVVEVTGKAIEYRDLTRQVQANQTLYDAVYARLKEIDVTKNMNVIPMEVYQLATYATTAPPPSKKYLLFGIFGGAIAGIGLAIGLHLLDPSVKTVDEAETVTGLEVIATVPPVEKQQADLTLAKDRGSLVAESFRTLRTALMSTSASEDEERRVFLFTSALPGEGKTFCSSNFAIALGHQELRTVIIDADLRAPALSKLFFKENKRRGLADVLASRIPWKDALAITSLPYLTVLPAGERAINPSELLGSRSFGKLIEELLLDFDRVVIDCAPCLAVSDPRLLVPYADISVLVLHAFSTPKSVVKRALRTLTDARPRPMAVVLNKLPQAHGNFSSYYSGAYGSPEVYGAAPGKGAV